MKIGVFLFVNLLIVIPNIAIATQNEIISSTVAVSQTGRFSITGRLLARVFITRAL